MGIISVERVLAAPGSEVIFQGECRVRKEVVEEEFWGAPSSEGETEKNK